MKMFFAILLAWLAICYAKTIFEGEGSRNIWWRIYYWCGAPVCAWGAYMLFKS